MKLAGAKAAAFCRKPAPDVRAALLFGEDAGLVSFEADALVGAWLKADLATADIIRLTEEDLKRDALALVDHLEARSLLGSARVVRIRIDREASAKPVLEAAAAIDAGDIVPEAFWIVEGGDLSKTSKLRATFEGGSKIAALHFIPDDAEATADFVRGRLTAAGVGITPDAFALFCAELPGDRRLAEGEVEKLELYALDLGRAVEIADIRVIASAEQERGADDAADAAIAGDAAGAMDALARFFDGGGNAISALRTLHFRLQRVLEANASGAPNGFRLRPPVFEREWSAFARASRDFSGSRLMTLFARLYEAERLCKQAGAPAEDVVRDLIAAIALRR